MIVLVFVALVVVLWFVARARHRAQLRDTAAADQHRPYQWSGRYLVGGYKGRRKYRT